MKKQKRVNTNNYYKTGGTKSDWLSEKIAEQMKLGKTLDEAITISNAIYNNGLPKKQMAGMWNANPNIQNQFQSPQQDFSNPNNQAYVGAIGTAMNSGGVPMSDGNSPTQSGMNMMQMQPQQFMKPPISMEDPMPPAPLYDGIQTPAVNVPLGDESEMYKQGDANLDGVVDNTNQQDPNGRVQFYNPYASFDIPSAGYRLGQGLQSGNGFDIGVSSLKLATGLGRNIAAGYGNANRRNYILKDAQERMREGSQPVMQYGQNGGYFQDGGMQMPPQEQGAGIEQEVASALQQGADPQAIVEQLIQNGVEESQAVSMVEAILQQLQGQQAPQMQMGGISKKKEEEDVKVATNEFVVEQAQGEKVAELEKNEIIKTPDGEIKQVMGKNHEQGGVEVTAEQLPDGSKILSDHLKVGKDGAKKFNSEYDLGIKSTDTYAHVLTKYNRKTGLTKLVEEQEMLAKNLQKQAKKLIENPTREETIKLNIELLQGEFNELEEQKAPLEEARKVLFEEIFQPQEESKETFNKEEVEKPIMQDGGIYNGDIITQYSQQYGIPPERIKELMNIHRDGGLQQYVDGGNPKNPYLQNSTVLNNFTNVPSVETNLPYTPIEVNPNEIWQGENYDGVWRPLVESSLANPEQASKVDKWLTENKGTFSPNIQKQLGTLKGVQRYAKIQQLALDGKPGPFHNAVLEALKATTPIKEEEPAIKPFSREGENNVQMRLLNLPDQSPLLPDSLQGALKQSTRYDRVEAPLQSPDAQINEIRRQETAAMESLNSLPDAQRASAIAQIQANTQANLNNVIAQTSGANQQAKFNANSMNAQIQAQEENKRNSNLTDYEGKILTADGKTQADIRNYFNTAQRVNLANFNAVRNANFINSMYDNKQFDGNGNIIATNLDYLPSYLGNDYKTEAQRVLEIENAKKLQKAQNKPKKRFGGKK